MIHGPTASPSDWSVLREPRAGRARSYPFRHENEQSADLVLELPRRAAHDLMATGRGEIPGKIVGECE